MRSVKAIVRNYVIASALLPVVLLWSPPVAPKSPLCSTPECKTRGAMYHKNRNDNGNPCRDFYEFVCGGWSKEHPRPPYEMGWSAHDLMQRATLGQLLSVLKKPASPKDSPDLIRARRVHNVCMNTPSLGRGDANFLAKHMEKVGFYPKTSLWDLHNGYVKLTGESPLFEMMIIANPQHNDEPLIQFQELASAYGSVVQLRLWNANQIQTYQTFLVNLFKSIRSSKRPALDDKALTKIVSNVIAFRFQLTEVNGASALGTSPKFEPMSVKDMQQWYNRYAAQSKTSEINWDTIVRNVYSTVSDAPLLANPQVAIRWKNYLLTLAQLISDTPEETLAYHFELYFMERHMTFTPTVIKTLDDFLTKTNGLTGYIRKDELGRPLKCIDEMNMDDAKGRLYVANFFKKTNVGVVEEMIEEIRDAMRKDILDAKWPDKDTKVATIRRINDITSWIGYPPWYDDPKVKVDETFMKPATINALLTVHTNRLCVNAAFMQSPTFDPKLPAVINFGAIGSTLGHEMYHALDECAKYRDSKGQWKTWWSSPMRDKCHLKKQCYVKQYTKLAMDELKTLQLASVTPDDLDYLADARRTFLEDLPDSMGLQSAYRAFVEKLKKQKNACAVLPNFERYSCEQMFFIAFGNSLCGSQVQDVALSSMRIHSPLRHRVNGAVMNNEGFGRAFGCTKGNPMYPKDTCNLWT